MQKTPRIIQFVPYFPPHVWGVEQYVADFSKNFVAFNAWEILIFTPNIGQIENQRRIDGYSVITYPSLELVHNFPIPKFWQRWFWKALKEAKDWGPNGVITHTRFFIPSLIGWLFAKITRIKWIHIEHGSWWVDSGNKLVNFCSWLYDQVIGRWILKYSDRQICVSRDVENFIRSKLWAKRTQVIYRWVELPKVTPQTKPDGKIIIGYIGRLIKWKNVENFIRAVYQLDTEKRNNYHFVIIWDGPEMEHLKLIDTNHIFEFTGNKPFQEALEIQASFDIHIHCSSQWGWLATTLLQAMYLGCMIVATPFEGANDVIENKKNGILLENDSIDTIRNGICQAIDQLEQKGLQSKVNQKILRSKFQWQKIIQKYYILIDNSND